MARHLTPPESPRSSDRTLLAPIKTDWTEESRSKPTGKMSLDFIAPSSRSASPENAPRAMLPSLYALSEAAAIARGSRPPSPVQIMEPTPTSYASHYASSLLRPHPVKEEHYTPVSAHSGGLPSPSWSCYSEPLALRERRTRHLHIPTADRRRSVAGYGHHLSSTSPLYTPHGMRPSRIQKRSSPKAHEQARATNGSRSERHPYDPEERYALIYWRRDVREKKLEWKDVVARFAYLFPENAPRRWKPKDSSQARGLPDRYPERNLQGLQCRLYRIRSEEDMPKVRTATANASLEPSVAHAHIELEIEKLNNMVRKHGLDPAFVDEVHRLGQKGAMYGNWNRARL